MAKRNVLKGLSQSDLMYVYCAILSMYQWQTSHVLLVEMRKKSPRRRAEYRIALNVEVNVRSAKAGTAGYIALASAYLDILVNLLQATCS